MSKFTSRQWLAIAGFFLLFIVLFFINRKAPAVEGATEQLQSGHSGAVIKFDDIIKESEDSLSPSDKKLVDQLKNSLKNVPDSIKVHILGRLSQVLDSIGQPVISAYYMEELAVLTNSPLLWVKSGQKFFDYSNIGKGDIREVFLNHAQICFKNAIAIDSNYADGIIGLGECRVELDPTPMSGIQTIMKVIIKDSNNRNAQIALGKLSIRSNQFEKAIYRFNRALQIDSSYKDAYVFLAEAYNGIGNKAEEVANLKKYRTFAPDSATRAEIDKIINHSEQSDTTK